MSFCGLLCKAFILKAHIATAEATATTFGLREHTSARNAVLACNTAALLARKDRATHAFRGRTAGSI